MSGIAGFIGLEGCGEETLEAAARSLTSVDADRTDSWSDGSASLVRVSHSLSNSETQPVFDENRSLGAVLTGEIFWHEKDRLELESRGHRFVHERSDAEIALRMFAEYGEDSFKRLSGSYVLVIYEASTGTLRVVTDRLATHPLFYYCAPGGGLAFSTRVDPIFSCPSVPKRLDRSAVFEFFTFQKLLGTKTYFEDIKMLPPASVLTFRDGGCRIAPYWEMRYRAEARSLEEFAGELAGRIRSSVERRLRGPERAGILLSGGLDSRAVLAAADRPIPAFTVGYPGDPDVTVAGLLAEASGSGRRILEPDSDHFSDLVDKAVEAGNGMYPLLHGWLIGFCDRFGDSCDTLLHGNPPELFFRGTSLPHHRHLSLLGRSFDLPMRTPLKEETLTDDFIRLVKRTVYGERPWELFTSSFADSYHYTVRSSAASILEEAAGRTENLYDRFLWSDTYYTSRYASYLINLGLREYFDERTALLFDNDLLELHLALPLRYREDNALWKRAIGRLDPGLVRIVDNNTGLPLTVPDPAVRAITIARKLPGIFRKHFGRRRGRYERFSQAAWSDYPELIRREGRFRKIVEETLSDPECMDPDIFDAARVAAILQDHLSGRRNAMNQIFLLLTFGRWYKNYGPKRH